MSLRSSKENGPAQVWLENLLYSNVWNEMRGWLRNHKPRYLQGKESVSDIIQSAYRLAFEKGDQCRGETPEEQNAWFRKIVKNKLKQIIVRYQSKKRKVGLERTPELKIDESVGNQPFAAIAGDEEWPDQQVLTNEIFEIVKQIVASLSEEQSRVIYLRFHEDESRVEIAETMNITPGKVSHLMRQAVLNLKSQLRDYDTGPERVKT